MERWRARVTGVILCALLIALGFLLWIFTSGAVELFLGVVTCLATLLTVGLQYRSSQAGMRVSPIREELKRTVDALAVVVGQQSDSEERLRRLRDPVPLPVRWVQAESLIMDHCANIGIARPWERSGHLDDVVGFFEEVESGRLVVLGGPGAGKTTLCHRFVLDVLERRRPGEPVPVIFSLASWDPENKEPATWMAERLANRYLRGITTRRVTLARQLVDAHLVWPIFEGLDEMAEQLRPRAIEAFNAGLGRGDRVLVTCRVDEYRASVEAADVLTAAAVVRLEPLDVDDAKDYLTRTTRKIVVDGTETTKWNPVFAFWRAHPENPLARTLMQVLATPLMVSLARTAYSDTDADPVELLDDRFTDRIELEDHLVDSFIPAVFPDRPPRHTEGGHDWRALDAEKYLARFAAHPNPDNPEDIAWWDLERTVPFRALRLSTGLLLGAVLGIVVALVDTIGNGLQYGLFFGLGALIGAVIGLSPVVVHAARGSTWLIVGLVTGLVSGFLFGPVLGLVVGLGTVQASAPASARPSTARIRFRRNHALRVRSTRAGLVLGSLSGLLSVVLVGSLAGFEVGLAVGLVVTFVVGFAVGMDIPADVTRAIGPAVVLRADRTSALIRGLVAGAVPGFVEGFAAGTEGGLVVGITAGGIVGLLVALGVVSSSAWARFTVARTWLACRGKLPWRLMSFLAVAHRRGILRQAGGAYQFAHDRVRARLDDRTRQSSKKN